jgi:hypothetical protein
MVAGLFYGRKPFYTVGCPVRGLSMTTSLSTPASLPMSAGLPKQPFFGRRCFSIRRPFYNGEPL